MTQQWRRLLEQVSRRVLRPNALTAEARLLLVLLVQLAAEGAANPGQRGLASQLGLSRDVVADRLRELAEYGFLARVAGSGTVPDSWRLDLDAVRAWVSPMHKAAPAEPLVAQNPATEWREIQPLVAENPATSSRARVNASSSSSQLSVSPETIERLATLLRVHGIPFRNPLKPLLADWMGQGISEDEVRELALEAARKGARSWAWMEACFRQRLAERAGVTGGAEIIDITTWRGGAAG